MKSREYLRVSRDKSGRVRSHDEQHDDNLRDANTLGWTLLDPPYKDVGSASRHSKKVRGDFDALLADLETGQFGADILQIWESSRGSRRVGEWVLLCDLLAERGVLVRVCTHGRTYDPRNGRDRRSLLEDAVDSEFEASKISERALRAASASAEAGRPHGKLQFGFQRTYHPRSGRLVGQVHDPEKAPLIQELFARLLARESLWRIWNDWSSRGIVNGQGRPFLQQHIRKMALSPAYAGLRVVSHSGESQSDGLTVGSRFVDATWEGIVSKVDFFAVRDLLTDSSRRTMKDGRTKHLLSMSSAARCDVCNGPISVMNTRYGQRYKCWRHGHLIVDREDLEKVAEVAILEYLRTVEYESLAQKGEDGDELRAVQDEMAVVQAELKELAARVRSGGLSVTFAASVEPGLRERLAGLEFREKILTTPSELRQWIRPGEDVSARWESSTIEARRSLARMVLSPEAAGRMVVTRSPTPRTRVPVGDRIRFERVADES